MKIKVYTAKGETERRWEGFSKDVLENWTLEHVCGGPWVMIEDLDSEYCRVTGIDKRGDIGDQAFLAWKPRLKKCETEIGGPIPETAKVRLEELRNEIRTGKVVIKNSRFIRVV